MDESLGDLIQELRRCAANGKGILDKIADRDDEGVRLSALRHCLERTVDLAEGCAVAAEAGLPQTLATVYRSLYETFVRTRWVSLSDENAQQFKDMGTNLLQKDLRKRLKVDPGAINPNTEAGRHAAAMLSMADPLKEKITNVKIPQGPGWDEMSREGGFEGLHTWLYGLFSIEAHGTTFGVGKGTVTTEDMLVTFIETAIGLVAAITIMIEVWVSYKRVTPVKAIKDIFQV